jgi:hypothetical protein
MRVLYWTLLSSGGWAGCGLFFLPKPSGDGRVSRGKCYGDWAIHHLFFSNKQHGGNLKRELEGEAIVEWSRGKRKKRIRFRMMGGEKRGVLRRVYIERREGVGKNNPVCSLFRLKASAEKSILWPPPFSNCLWSMAIGSKSCWVHKKILLKKFNSLPYNNVLAFSWSNRNG